MDTNYIQEFLVLRETGSFLKAAELLGIPQSTLSRHIQAIEAEIGKQLIHRTRHSFQVTAAGSAFTIYATTVLEAQKNLVSDFESYRTADDGFLNIGMVHGTEKYGILDMLTAFHKEEPDIHLNIYTSSGATLIYELQHSLCDVIFAWDLDNGSLHDRAIPFAEDMYVLHIPLGHRLFGKKRVYLSELKSEEVYIRCSPYLRMYNIIMKKCAQAGTNLDLKPYPGCWMSTPDNFLYMTLRQQIDRIRHSGQFSIAEMDPSPEMKLDIHYSADHNSDATLKFLDFASRYTHLGISAEKP